MIRPATAAGALVLSLVLPSAAAAEEIAPGVHLVAGRFEPGRQPDGNSILLRGADGLVVVDTGRHVEHTRAVLELARELGAPIVAVVNTHWHLDHLGGNVLLRREVPGVRVHASGAIAAAREGFLARYRRQLADMIEQTEEGEQRQVFVTEAALIDAGDALEPDEVIATAGPRALAGRRLEHGLEGPAVTAGDLWVVDTETRTLITGDLVTLPVPFLDTACPSGWSAALEHLVATDFDRAVPGHGPVMTRPQLEAYRSSFEDLLSCAGSTRAVEECADAWITGLGDLLPSSEHAFTRQLLDYYVGQVLRGDRARTAELCGE